MPRCISNEKIFSRYAHLNSEVLITKYIIIHRRRKRGIVCASAGNHAQGVALPVINWNKGHDFYASFPHQTKTRSSPYVWRFNVEIRLTGDTFDDAYAAASLLKMKPTVCLCIHLKIRTWLLVKQRSHWNLLSKQRNRSIIF